MTAEQQQQQVSAATEKRPVASAPVTNGNMKTLQEKATQMSAKFEEMRKSRLAMEHRAERLQQLLDHERRERQAWLAAFLGALQNTLSDLNSCVDRSMEESGKLMRGRLEQADGRMQRLMHRVDEIFTSNASTKEQATAPSTLPSSPGIFSRASTDLSSSAQVRKLPTPLVTGKVPTQVTPVATGNRLAAMLAQRAAAPATAPGVDANGGGAVDAAGGTEELMQCWTELLSENLTLQQRHKALIEEKQRVAKSSGPSLGSSRSASRGRASPDALGGSLKSWMSSSAGGSPRVSVQGTMPRLSTSSAGAQMPVVREIG